MQTMPSAVWRSLAHTSGCHQPPRGMDALWHRAAGLAAHRVRNRRHYLQQAEVIASVAKGLRTLSDRVLQKRISDLHERFGRGRDSVADRNLALAVVCETADRHIGLRPHPVQIAGALAIEAGCLIEMATGEGKTLVAALPAVLAGWRGHGCHVITANPYLAARDADLMNALFSACGLAVGCVEEDMGPLARKAAYDAQVTYVTNKAVAADFLRDRLALGHVQGTPEAIVDKIIRAGSDRLGSLVQRGLARAIVDEADAVLIDEAVSPLIISGQSRNKDQVKAFQQAAGLAAGLAPDIDFRVDRRRADIELTPAGRQRLAKRAASLGGLWQGTRRREEMIAQALAARLFFARDSQYVVDGGKVVIVDEFTGRLMPDRNWRDGLHQAIEAKEGLAINLPKETLARISFQRFFRLYHKLAGMTGTAAEAQSELWQNYRLAVIPMPTHRPCRRRVLPERMFAGTRAKWKAVVDAIGTVHRTGRPVLIGTRSVGASEHLSGLLRQAGLAHRVLNAVRRDREAHIIAAAGQRGHITVATNMAGRGTDIRLGPGVADMGGLHVIATERHEARRIDRQLFGRCARQGDPGSAQGFCSLDDDIIQKYAHRLAVGLIRRSRADNGELTGPAAKSLIDRAQRQAEKTALRMRSRLLRNDHWLEEQLGFAGKEF